MCWRNRYFCKQPIVHLFVFSSVVNSLPIHFRRLANKQDKENALDEIDVVEQLDVEHVVNKYRCPTRVEICSAYTPDTIKIDKGIKSGFR